MEKFMKHLMMAALTVVIAGLGSARAASPQITLAVSGDVVSPGVPALSFNSVTQRYSFGGNDSYVYITDDGEYLTTSTSLVPKNQQIGQKDWRFAIQVKVADNAPGLASGAQLFDVTSDVRSNGNIGGGFSGKSVTITLQDSSFNLPTGLVYLSSVVQGTLGSESGSDTFQSFFTQSGNNHQTTLQDIGSSDSTVNSTTFTNSGTFTLKNVTTVTLNPDETSSTNGRTYLLPVGSVNAVPEPATTTLALTGLAAFGLVGLRRRRLAKTSV